MKYLLIGISRVQLLSKLAVSVPYNQVTSQLSCTYMNWTNYHTQLHCRQMANLGFLFLATVPESMDSYIYM